MINSKILAAIVAVGLILAAAVWFERSTDAVETADPVAQDTEQTESGGAEAVSAPTGTAETEGVSSTTEATETNAATQSGTVPTFDTTNWVCTAWEYAQSGERTCIQWSVRSGAAPEQ
jgi:hypothetical protein